MGPDYNRLGYCESSAYPCLSLFRAERHGSASPLLSINFLRAQDRRGSSRWFGFLIAIWQSQVLIRLIPDDVSLLYFVAWVYQGS